MSAKFQLFRLVALEKLFFNISPFWEFKLLWQLNQIGCWCRKTKSGAGLPKEHSRKTFFIIHVSAMHGWLQPVLDFPIGCQWQF